jgi:hypothetical protein
MQAANISFLTPASGAMENGTPLGRQSLSYKDCWLAAQAANSRLGASLFGQWVVAISQGLPTAQEQ